MSLAESSADDPDVLGDLGVNHREHLVLVVAVRAAATSTPVSMWPGTNA
jgi:hypothetical protein